MTSPPKALNIGRPRRRAKEQAAASPPDFSAPTGEAAEALAVQLKLANRDIRRLKAQLSAALATIDELRSNADTDFLLGILNRRGFERELDRSIAYIKRYQANGALIMMDVDRLKPINDRYGHAAGDEVLKAVVGVMLRQVRTSDVVARLGGDEFVLLLWNLTEADANAKAQALETAVDQLRFEFDGHQAVAGISTGVALLGPQSDSREALAAADHAMYARKALRHSQAEASESVAR
jgi:diguanylate cyclase (GGDEF)-like protein